MDNRPNLPTAPADVSNGLRQSSVFGPPPLFEGEDAAAYDELLAHVSAAVKPKDFLEQIWVRDVVDLTWETLRMRRLRAKLFHPEKITIEVVSTSHWAREIDTFERIDRMVMSAEVRRNAALREIERHRTSIAHAMRRASDDVLDGEFEDVAPDQGTQKKVA